MWRTKRPKSVENTETVKEQSSKKRKTLHDYCEPYHLDSRTATAVSIMEQSVDPGRNTLSNALSAGFTPLEVLDEDYGDWSKLSASKLICDCDDPEALNAWAHIKAVLGDEIFRHSRLYYGDDAAACEHKKKRFTHFRFGGFGSKMQQSYHEVGTLVDALAIESGYTKVDKVGTDVCSASIFQSSPDIDKNFLDPHTDTHSLPTLFFSLSDGESWVHYTKNDEVVAKLSVPAGLNVIVTSEIHSGLKAFNPNGVVHFFRECGRPTAFPYRPQSPSGWSAHGSGQF